MRKRDLEANLSYKLGKKLFNGFFFAFLSGLRVTKSLRETCLFAKELGSFVPSFILMKR